MTGKWALPKETKAVLRVLRTELRSLGADVRRIANAVVELYDVAQMTGADNVRRAEGVQASLAAAASFEDRPARRFSVAAKEL